MSKWKSILHAIERCFMCCIRTTNIIDRMTKTIEEEQQTPNPYHNHDRKASIAKIIITKADNNEEHIEFTQPITIKYMGQVIVNNQTNYYTPNVTPNNSPRVSIEDCGSNPFVEKRKKHKSEPILIRNSDRTIGFHEGRFLAEILAQQNALKEGSSVENNM